MLEKSLEDIIPEFNEKFQKIDKRFDQLELISTIIPILRKLTNLSENLANKVIELKVGLLPSKIFYYYLL